MTEDYRQKRCRHGWVNQDECQDCKDIAALTSQRDKATQDVVDLMKQRRSLLDERETLNKQIAALRRALEEIREIWAGSEIGEPVTAQEGYAIRLCKQMYKTAVEALWGEEIGDE